MYLWPHESARTFSLEVEAMWSLEVALMSVGVILALGCWVGSATGYFPDRTGNWIMAGVAGIALLVLMLLVVR